MPRASHWLAGMTSHCFKFGVLTSGLMLCGAILFLLLLHPSFPRSPLHLTAPRRKLSQVPESPADVADVPDLSKFVRPDYQVLDKAADAPKLAATETTNVSPVTNPHPFHFVIDEPTICSKIKSGVFLLIFIHTAPAHYKRRMAIRETWGSKKLFDELGTVTLFSMGQTKDRMLQEAIEFESNRYHDVLQENFIDSYRNLTYKAIGWLKWTANNCPQARFILKTDDDIFTNIFLLTTHLRTLVSHKMAPRRSLVCLVWWRMHVYREGKWGVPKDMYQDDLYPVYCSGSAYILTADIAAGLYNVSQYVDFFWVDDVYVTGMLPKALGNVTHQSLESVYVFKREEFETRFYGRVGKNAGTGIFGHVGKINIFYDLWSKILQRMDRTDLMHNGKSLLRANGSR